MYPGEQNSGGKPPVGLGTVNIGNCLGAQAQHWNAMVSFNNCQAGFIAYCPQITTVNTTLTINNIEGPQGVSLSATDSNVELSIFTVSPMSPKRSITGTLAGRTTIWGNNVPLSWEADTEAAMFTVNAGAEINFRNFQLNASGDYLALFQMSETSQVRMANVSGMTGNPIVAYAVSNDLNPLTPLVYGTYAELFIRYEPA